MFSMVGKYPVLEGVFSFMLWGTCRGRKEPTYYNKVLLLIKEKLIKTWLLGFKISWLDHTTCSQENALLEVIQKNKISNHSYHILSGTR